MNDTSTTATSGAGTPYTAIRREVDKLRDEVERITAERDHYRGWIEAMLADDHLWREQGEERLRLNVQMTLRGAFDQPEDAS